MRYFLIFSCSVVFFSCKVSSKLSSSYSLGIDKVFFDTAKKKFKFVERGELSFYGYSEGSYIMSRKEIILQPYIFDSCITYKNHSTQQLHIINFHCVNYDKRLQIVYKINDSSYIRNNDNFSFSVLNDTTPLKIAIQIPFPEFYGATAGTCYKKFDFLSRGITVNTTELLNEGLWIDFNINYNYFNWVSMGDTLTVKSQNKLLKSKSNLTYIKDRVSVNPVDNYLSQCMMFFVPPKH